MKILFGMILLMFVAVYGCTTNDSPAIEQTASDVVEIGDITVEDVEEEVTPSDAQVSLDTADIVSTVDVEN